MKTIYAWNVPRHIIRHSTKNHSINGVTNLVSNIPNDELDDEGGADNYDNCSIQSPFSVPTVDLFPIDSTHSILTNDIGIDDDDYRERSSHSLALSPSTSKRSLVGMMGSNSSNTMLMGRTISSQQQQTYNQVGLLGRHQWHVRGWNVQNLLSNGGIND